MGFRLWRDPYDDAGLEPGPYGIMQPDEDAPAVTPALAFVPLVAFTARGEQAAVVAKDELPDGVREMIEQQWMPRLEAFRPQMIFISAGFDAHREDDLGQLGMVEADYEWITRRVKDVADRHAQGRIVSCLEGGYNLDALARSVEAHVRVLADL